MHVIISACLFVSIFIRILKIFFGDFVYIIAVIPLLFSLLYVILTRGISFTSINNVDFFVGVMLILLLSNLLISALKGHFNTQLIFILYVILPILLYTLFRIIRYDITSFSKLMCDFTFLYSIYIIVEFFAYYLYPELRAFGSNYLKYEVETLNFSPPYIRYPFLGYATKPWGPMLDASASGAFLIVLYSFIYDSQKYINLYYSKIVLLLGFIAIFLSGSKSAYFMFIIYVIFRNILFVNFRITLFNILMFFSISIFVLFLLYFSIGFFFPEELLYFYINSMFVDPIVFMFEGFLHNGWYVILGLGQESASHKIIGLGEVDYINAIFRYGVIFMLIFTLLMLHLILLAKRNYVEFACLFTMFIISMNHYQVALKYPASVILFMAIAVFLNCKKHSNENTS